MVIYMVRNKINNKIYFGQTTNVKGFKGRYANNFPKHCSNEHIRASIAKYGWSNFEVVEEFDRAESLDELNKLEEMYIKMWGTYDREYGYNIKFGGYNHKGRKCSEETKKKLSEAGKGRVFTEEHRKHLSEANKGRPKTEEQVKQHSEFMKGNTYGRGNKGKKRPPYTEETKAKLREANLGKIVSEETKEKLRRVDHSYVKKKVLCLNNGILYDSAKEAGLALNIHPSSITRCCKGVYKQVKGYRFKYGDE